jgi:hypothetical protein
MSEAAQASTPTKNGRKSHLPVTEKIAALEAQLQAARTEEREALKRRAAIVGAIIIKTMNESPEFKSTVVTLLKAKLGTRERIAVADLLS